MATYNDIMLARMVFEKFWNQELPFKTAEKIENFLLDTNQFRDEVEAKRLELLEKYAAKDENGILLTQAVDDSGTLEVNIINRKKFFKKFNEFLDSEVLYNFDEDNYFTEDELNLLKCSPEEVHNVKWYTHRR